MTTSPEPPLPPEPFTPDWRERFKPTEDDLKAVKKRSQLSLELPPGMLPALDRMAFRHGWSRRRLILMIFYDFLVRQGVDCSEFKYHVFRAGRSNER